MIASENCWSFPVWQAGVISKVAAFLWLALKAKVLTCDRLTRRGIRVLSCCDLCGKEDERLSHLLLHWLYARFIWQHFWGLFDFFFLIRLERHLINGIAICVMLLCGSYDSCAFHM